MPKLSKRGRVMVFGIFDCFHAGHKFFLREAWRQGRELIAIVARDRMAHLIKRRKPYWGERKRLKTVRAFPGVTRAVLGDSKRGTYGVIKKYKPDIVCLGYDQHGFAQNLRAWLKRQKMKSPMLARLAPHHPHKFKTSRLRPDGRIKR